MKKTLICLSFILSTAIGYSQNIEFEKDLDTEIVAPAYYSRTQRLIHYEKCFDEKVARIDYTNIQLFSKNMELEWEHQFEELAMEGTTYNLVDVVASDKAVYYLQIGSSGFTSKGAEKLPLRISKIAEDGTIITKDFTGAYEVRGLESFEIINDKLYLIYYGYAVDGLETMYLPHIATLDLNLEPVGEIYSLNIKGEDGKFNHRLNYAGFQNGNFLFKDFFYIKKNGKYANDDKSQQQLKTLSVSLDLKSEISEIESSGVDYDIREVTQMPIKYDSEEYSVEVIPVYKEKSHTWSSNIPFEVTQLFQSVFVSKGELKSENLLVELRSILGKGKKMPFAITDVIKDPINNGISIVFQNINGAGTSYSVSLTNDLKIVYAQPFSVESTFAQRPNYDNLSLSFKGADESIGKHPADYQINALDYVTNLNQNCFFTIVNYDDFQLLFLDDKNSGSIKALKFVR